MIEKAYRYRIYPNKEQKIQLHKTFGCVRFVFNHYLDRRMKVYETEKRTLGYYDCAKELPGLKKEYPWLKEVDSIALQSTLRDLDDAYKSFFRKDAGYPNFKSKKTHRFSYKTKCVNGNIQYQGRYLKLPKLGVVKTRNKQIPEGRILNATITQEPSGNYYVSLCCTEVEVCVPEKTGCEIGIDLGIKDFAVTSDGRTCPNPKYLNASQKKLARYQRALSRKTRGGANWAKARIKVARIQEHIANQRKDYLQKLSTELIRDYDVICLETLRVKEMMKNHRLAKQIADVSWAEFVRELEYKASWYKKKVIKVDAWYASSQICNSCGAKSGITKDLSVREWICPKCGRKLDRDINAAKNILAEGRKRMIVA
ncbi:MAG: IS200/IS605 family element RNA-guided endonuclease TnpB [Eubacteriales bacterium]|nr:IS200/IS605 family element RNA-guided endonuclease TnpB [Eubacteriales bacterium]